MPSSSEYPVAGVRIVADTSDYDQAIRQIISSASRLDAESVTVNVTADTQSAKSELSALDNALDESQTVNVTADTTDAKSDLSVIQDQLANLQTLSIISLVLDAAQFIQTFESLPIISQLAATDSALASVEARTGAAIAGLDDVINRIYVETGAERGTIADALVPLIQAGETSLAVLEDLGTRSIEFSQVWGEDVNKALFAANQLIGTGLADNSEEAFDILVYGMQTGANRAGDFLDLIGEFGADFATLGLTGQQMIDLTNASLDAGAQNAGRYGEAINSLSQNFGAMGEETSAIVEETGIDPANLGLDGLETLITHLQDIEDQAARTAAITATFGSGGTEIGEALTFVLPDETETRDSITGTADEMSAAIDDSLTEAIREAGATLETTFIEALDNALDISGFLEKITEGAKEFAELIAGGMEVGEAIELSFGIEGFADFVTRLESGLGNVVIAILELVAGIQDIRGVSAVGTRAEIARLAGGQLAFDLQVANEDEVAGMVQTALDRGVSGAALGEAAATAVQELIAAGQLEQAQALVDQLEQVPAAFIEATDLLGQQLPTLAVSGELDADATQAAIDAATNAAPIGVRVQVVTTDIDTEALQQQINNELDTGGGKTLQVPVMFDPTEQAMILAQDQSQAVQDLQSATVGGAVTAADVANAAAAVAFGDAFIAAAEATAMAESDTVSSMEGIEEAAIAMGDTVTEVIQGNTVIDDFDLMAASALETEPLVTGAVGGMETAFVTLGDTATSEMDRIIGKLMELQSGFTTFIGDLGNLGNLGNIMTNSTTTANVNIVNNNQSNAQAVSANQQTASAIRGVTA